MSVCWSAAGRWSEAETQYRQGISYDSRYEPLWRNYGMLLARMGRYEEALSAFEQVESRAEASNDVGYICMIEGKLGEAEQFFQSAIDQSPSHYEMAWENLQRIEQIRRLRQRGMGQGAVEEAPEVPVLFKTGEDAAPRLLARIGELHSYDVPAAVVWPIQAALPAYVEWVIGET